MARKRRITAIIVILGIGLAALIIKGPFNGLPGRKLLPPEIRPVYEDSGFISEEEIRNDQGNYGLYDPKMLTGKWIRKDVRDSEMISLPSPDVKNRKIRVCSMPEEIIFVQDINRSATDPNYKNVPDISSSFLEMRGIYRPAPSDPGAGEDSTADCVGIYDINGSCLAVGMIGVNPDRYTKMKDAPLEKVTEIDYEMEWEGPFLTLSYRGASARYVPSSYENCPEDPLTGDLDSGEPGNPDLDFSRIMLESERKGKVNTVYGNDIAVTYRFDPDHSFHAETDEGIKWDYDKYLLSDNNLVLRKKKTNLTYMKKVRFTGGKYPRKYFNVSDGAYELNGAMVNDFSDRLIADLAGSGFILPVDLESPVAAGAVTEEFPVEYNGAEFKVQACNISNISLPLRLCFVCRISVDLSKNITIHNLEYKTAVPRRSYSYGADKEEILKDYDNLVPIGEDYLCACRTIIHLSDDKDISKQGGILTALPANSKMMLLTFRKNRMTAFTLLVPAYYYRDMQFNIDDIKTASEPLPKIMAAAEVRDKQASEITKAFKKRFGNRIHFQRDQFGQKPTPVHWEQKEAVLHETTGSLLIPWPHLFVYGKPELSGAGKKFLDQAFSCLQDCAAGETEDRFTFSDAEICAYTRLLDKETAADITQRYADAVRDYAESRMKGLNFISKGCGVTGYLSAADQENYPGPFIEIHFKISTDASKAASYKEQTVKKKVRSGEHKYVDPELPGFNDFSAAFARKYQGVYGDKSYSVSNLDLEWKLPDGWHFANDDELQILNGESAETLLNEKYPIFVMAAYSKDYASMAHLRLYPGASDASDGGNENLKDNDYAKDLSKTMHDSIRARLEEYAEDIKETFKEEEVGGRKQYRSVFSYRDGDRTYRREVKYTVRDDVLAVMTEIYD